MIIKCKDCGTKLNIDETDYEYGVPSTTICPLCGEEVSFTIPKPEAKSRKSKVSDKSLSEEKEKDLDSPTAPTFVYCSECGTKISKGIKFCPNCGSRIQHEANVGEIITEPIETNPAEDVSPANNSAPIVNKNPDSSFKKWIGFVIAVIIIVGSFFALKSAGVLSDSSDKAPVDIKTDRTAVEVLTDIVTKARNDGANWTIDQWKYVYKQAAIAIKPIMLEIADLTKEDNLTENNIDEVMEKLEKLQTEFEPIEKLLDEFVEIAKSTPNGKAVDEDKDFEKQLQEELGLPDL